MSPTSNRQRPARSSKSKVLQCSSEVACGGAPIDPDVSNDFDAGLDGLRIPRTAHRLNPSEDLIAAVLTGDCSPAQDSVRLCRRCSLLHPFARLLEFAQPSGVCGVRLGLDFAILVDQPPAERRQSCAATVASARLGSDDGLAEAIVHVVDQQPCPAVRHAERDSGSGDRSGVANRLEQSDLARADRPVLAEIDAQGKPRRCHVGSSQPASFKGAYDAEWQWPSNQASPHAGLMLTL
jgi:hypothetical protein